MAPRKVEPSRALFPAVAVVEEDVAAAAAAAEVKASAYHGFCSNTFKILF